MERYDSYKDSGVDWIGQIPEHWEVQRLASYFDERRVKVSDKEYPALSVTKNGICGQLENVAKTDNGDNRKLVLDGDFVINSRSDRKGSSGLSSLCGSVSLINIVLAPRKHLLIGQFAHFLLKSHYFIEEYYRNGRGIVADLWTTRYSEMKLIKLAIPPISEQQAIAAYLDEETGKLDDAVEKLERMVEVLKERKQLIISKAVTRGLDDSVPLKDSGVECIGQIPKHWQELKIKFCLENKPNNMKVGPFGSDLKSSDYSITGYWVYNQRTVLDQNFTSNEIFVNKKKFQQLSAFEVFPGDFLITTRGTIGKVAIVPDNYFKGILHPCIIRFRVDDRILNKYYLRYIFNGSDVVINQILSKSNATTIDAIYSSSLKDIKVTIPEYNEQCAIVAYLDEETGKLDAAVEKLERMIELLKERKQILISDVVTGKIKVA